MAVVIVVGTGEGVRASVGVGVGAGVGVGVCVSVSVGVGVGAGDGVGVFGAQRKRQTDQLTDKPFDRQIDRPGVALLAAGAKFRLQRPPGLMDKASAYGA